VEANVAFALWRPDMRQNMSAVIGRLLDEMTPLERAAVGR
jgi:UTP--glucose-1-phosphate uridylyltransferase